MGVSLGDGRRGAFRATFAAAMALAGVGSRGVLDPPVIHEPVRPPRVKVGSGVPGGLRRRMSAKLARRLARRK